MGIFLVINLVNKQSKVNNLDFLHLGFALALPQAYLYLGLGL